MTVEEARGNVRGREYHGLVYSVTDDKGNKVGNPFKSCLLYTSTTGFSTFICGGMKVRKPSIALLMSTFPEPSL